MVDTVFNPVFPPALRDVLDRVKLDTARSINCVQIGTIKSYDATKNLATVSLKFLAQPADGSTPIEYPTLLDVPCFFLFGGASFFSMPITTGDTCLVLFNDRDIDNWYVSGQTLTPNSERVHSLSDGIALVGIRGAFNPAALSAVDVLLNAAAKLTITTTGDATITASAGKVGLAATLGTAELKGQGSTVDAGTGLLTLKNTPGGNLKEVLTNLLSALSSLQTVPDPGLPTHDIIPATFATAIGAVQTALNLILG